MFNSYWISILFLILNTTQNCYSFSSCFSFQLPFCIITFTNEHVLNLVILGSIKILTGLKRNLRKGDSVSFMDVNLYKCYVFKCISGMITYRKRYAWTPLYFGVWKIPIPSLLLHNLGSNFFCVKYSKL